MTSIGKGQRATGLLGGAALAAFASPSATGAGLASHASPWHISVMRREHVPVDRADARLELARLFEETVGLYWRLTRAASAIYGRGPMSGPRRSVLLAFSRSEPQTVARLASSRAQSRQGLQALVNELIEEGLLERKKNPFHQRSDLIGLTKRGLFAVQQSVKAEAELRRILPLKVSARSIDSATRVLRHVNSMFDDPDVLMMLKKHSRVRR